MPAIWHSRRVSERRGKKRWSDSSLQVEDPKASGTPTCLAVTCATFPSSATIVVDRSIMQNGSLTKVLNVSARYLHSDAQPSTVAYVIVTQHQQDGCSVITVGRGTLVLLRTQLISLGESREL